ncbi:hypothetical protein J5N97_017187 [Dioscorea zingiberensis]|uniref:Uncharacterized protein n=1 Tax=Dioscorea zingiberensis TaxID=325984 RepID=A0A9D5CMQ1_9LILI|nr:hypothetical protein J5N97_017187 [Dioscorea zingiberensis]
MKLQAREVRYASVEEAKIIPYREEASLVLYRMTSVQDFLPILTAIPELPSESQQQLLRLPADLAGKLLSRCGGTDYKEAVCLKRRKATIHFIRKFILSSSSMPSSKKEPKSIP